MDSRATQVKYCRFCGNEVKHGWKASAWSLVCRTHAREVNRLVRAGKTQELRDLYRNAPFRQRSFRNGYHYDPKVQRWIAKYVRGRLGTGPYFTQAELCDHLGRSSHAHMSRAIKRYCKENNIPWPLPIERYRIHSHVTRKERKKPIRQEHAQYTPRTKRIVAEKLLELQAENGGVAPQYEVQEIAQAYNIPDRYLYRWAKDYQAGRL